MTAEYPKTIRTWLDYMAEHGTSNRPFPTEDSDLFRPDKYADPLDIKPERAALGAVFSIRAYQRAKILLLDQRETLSQPSSATLSTPDELYAKSSAIGDAFTDAMVTGLLADEQHVRKLPNRYLVSKAYRRFDAILAPLVAKNADAYRVVEIERTGRKIRRPSPVFIDVNNGIHALPTNIDGLLELVTEGYYQEHVCDPDIPTIIAAMRANYPDHIDRFASMHKDDTERLGDLHEKIREEGDPMGIHEFQDGVLIYKADVMKKHSVYQRSVKGKRSRTTTCSFLAKTSDVAPFLDQPVDFEDPMLDAFNLHMELLEA